MNSSVTPSVRTIYWDLTLFWTLVKYDPIGSQEKEIKTGKNSCHKKTDILVGEADN